jgi:hypothetical protein
MALGGNTPIDHICKRVAKTPLADEVDARYDPQREKLGVADYKVDMVLVQLRCCQILHLKADTVGRMAITGKTDFKCKVRSSMRRLQNDPGKICSFYQKPSLKYAA